MSVHVRPYRVLLAAAASAIVVAFIGGTLTDVGPWYQSLRQPSWRPPDWLYGPAWTIMYALAVLSFVSYWRVAPSRQSREWLIGLFSLNGFLNILWSLLFFRLQRPDWSLIEVVIYAVSTLGLIVFVARHSKCAAWLLAPYLAWVVFAGFLNYWVVKLNAPF